MILYAAANTCSMAAQFALAEADIDHSVKMVDFSNQQQRSADYIALNPKGHVPVLVDGEFVLTEVPAILRYIALQSKVPLWPVVPFEDARCAEWLAWLSSTVHSAYAHMRRPYRYADDEEHQLEVSRKGRETCHKLWAEIEVKLVGQTYSVGDDYSVADAYLLVMWLWGRGPALKYDMHADFPTWTEQARRVGARPKTSAVFRDLNMMLP